MGPLWGGVVAYREVLEVEWLDCGPRMQEGRLADGHGHDGPRCSRLLTQSNRRPDVLLSRKRGGQVVQEVGTGQMCEVVTCRHGGTCPRETQGSQVAHELPVSHRLVWPRPHPGVRALHRYSGACKSICALVPLGILGQETESPCQSGLGLCPTD